MNIIRRFEDFSFEIVNFSMTSDKETAIFRAQFGEDFPDLAELATKVHLPLILP